MHTPLSITVLYSYLSLLSSRPAIVVSVSSSIDASRRSEAAFLSIVILSTVDLNSGIILSVVVLHHSQLCSIVLSLSASKDFVLGIVLDSRSDDKQKLWFLKHIPISIDPKLNRNFLNRQSLTILDVVSFLKNQRSKICILSIDGDNAMRRITIGKVLAYLENSLKKKSKDTNTTIVDYFDVVTGAGVGGIFTAMLFATKDHKWLRFIVIEC
ncbi:hypothetical protein AHAS_Ahas19G0129400 [Arachis hypogaea]